MIKLIGSKSERDNRQQLVSSHELLFHCDSYQYLLEILYSYFPNMNTAYFIDHVQDQEYNLYTLLINTDIITKIEIEEHLDDRNIVIENFSINEYKKGKKKKDLIRLAVAIDLAKKDKEGIYPKTK